MTFLFVGSNLSRTSIHHRPIKTLLPRAVLTLATSALLMAGCAELTPPTDISTSPQPQITTPLPTPVPSFTSSPTPSPTPAPSPAPTPQPTPRLPSIGLPPLVERPAPVSARFEQGDFTRLPAMTEADLIGAWAAWINSCNTLPTSARTRSVPWGPVCEAANLVDPRSIRAIRAYWVTHFNVWLIHPLDAAGTVQRGRLTGYYEPELIGSRQRGGAFTVPLTRPPADLLTIDLSAAMPELAGQRLRGRLAEDADSKRRQVVPYWTRAELQQGGRLNGLELAWVNNPIEAFFLQVQGSGRVKLADGPNKDRVVRLGYADTNGHPYRSIGRWLVEQGEMLPEQASMQGIQEWARTNPKRLNELLNQNPSYVFFRELPLGDPNAGPVGSLNIALTAGFSAAVDPAYTPLGTPIVISSTHPETRAPLKRLVFAQDTGSAIRGPARVDLFWGTGRAAGELAGRSRDEVTVWMFLPKGVNPATLLAPAR